MTFGHHIIRKKLSLLLLTLLPASGVFADQHEWTFNEHGAIKACSVLTEDQDGSPLLVRYLILPSEKGRETAYPGLTKGSQYNATDALISAQAQRPDKTHFLTEYYYLDQNHLILNAQLAQGHTDSLQPPWTASRADAAAYCSEVNQFLGQATDASAYQAEPGCSFISHRWNIIGLQASQEAFGQPVTLEQPAAPVMMLSGDKAVGYQQVYDPLYSLHETLNFDALRYWQYQDSPTFQVALASLSGAELAGGVATLGAGIATLNPALIAVGGGLTISSIATGLYAYYDWIQNPESRAQSRDSSLASQQKSLQQQLVRARDSEASHQQDLQDMGLYGSEAYIREKEVQYDTAELLHSQRLSFLHEELIQLKSGRTRLQANLDRSTHNESRQPASTATPPETEPLYQTSDDQQTASHQEYALPTYTELDPYPEYTQRLSSSDTGTHYPEALASSDVITAGLPDYENLPPAYSHQDPHPLHSVTAATIDPPPLYDAGTAPAEASTSVSDAMTFVTQLLVDQIADNDTRISLKEAQINAETLAFELAHGKEGRALKGYSAAKRTIRESEDRLVNTKEEQLRVAEEFKIMQLLNSYQRADIAAR
ncbi:MAG: hypothetical protein ACR2PX_22825 [Endozoicomonas sp.]|uniref:hypothetical protein n=1 Tax=Endozoicomonas sp. TaxID=1892382 RepID=UPI003D9BE353